MTREADCIFCKVVAVEIPAAVVYEDDALLAFLDINPLAEGHLLVAPRDHYPRLYDLPAELCARLSAVLPRFGRALLEVTGAAGFNVLQNNGEAAGQTVDHVHFHLIPRRAGDNLGYRWNAGPYPDGRASELVGRYQRVLAKLRG